MFGWFRTRCPVETHEKVWTDRWMSWLVQAFGIRRLREAVVVLPTEEFFPDPYDGTEADALGLYRQVGRFMGIDPGRAQLDFFDEAEYGFADEACVYVPGSPERILVNREQLADPLALVAALAHGIGNLLLMGDGRIAEDEPDRAGHRRGHPGAPEGVEPSGRRSGRGSGLGPGKDRGRDQRGRPAVSLPPVQAGETSGRRDHVAP
jgi:hypothetical protein